MGPNSLMVVYVDPLGECPFWERGALRNVEMLISFGGSRRADMSESLGFLW